MDEANFFVSVASGGSCKSPSSVASAVVGGGGQASFEPHSEFVFPPTSSLSAEIEVSVVQVRHILISDDDWGELSCQITSTIFFQISDIAFFRIFTALHAYVIVSMVWMLMVEHGYLKSDFLTPRNARKSDFRYPYSTISIQSILTITCARAVL